MTDNEMRPTLDAAYPELDRIKWGYDGTADTYEGWTNRETWLVALWINNDQGWQESVHDSLRDLDVAAPGGPTTPADIQSLLNYRAGDVVRESVEEMTYDDTSGTSVGLTADLLGTALGRVNWTELGSSFLADLESSS